METASLKNEIGQYPSLASPIHGNLRTGRSLSGPRTSFIGVVVAHRGGGGGGRLVHRVRTTHKKSHTTTLKKKKKKGRKGGGERRAGEGRRKRRRWADAKRGSKIIGRGGGWGWGERSSHEKKGTAATASQQSNKKPSTKRNGKLRFDQNKANIIQINRCGHNRAFLVGGWGLCAKENKESEKGASFQSWRPDRYEKT